MRSILILFLALLAFGSAKKFQTNYVDVPPAKSPKAFENKIKDVVECIKKNLNTGIPEVNLPSFNPLQLESEQIDLAILNISVLPVTLSGNVSVSDLVLSSVTNWNFNQLQGAVGILPPSFTANFNISNAQFDLKTDYVVNAAIQETGDELTGAGSLSVTVRDLSVGGKLKLKLMGREARFSISNADLAVDLGSIDFKITGLNSDEFSEALSRFISDNLPSLVAQNKNKISDILNETIMNAVNNSGETNPALQAIIDELTNRCS